MERMTIADVHVLDGDWSVDAPVVILDAATARRAIELGELHNLVLDALNALELSGKAVVFLKEDE
jgi:hypothetical protein